MSWGIYRKVQNFFHSSRKRTGNESVVTISYKIKFNDSARFMVIP